MAKANRELKAAPAPETPIRLDLGCGPRKQEGFIGVDAIAFPGVDVNIDLRDIKPSNLMLDAQGSSRHVEFFQIISDNHFYSPFLHEWFQPRYYGVPVLLVDHPHCQRLTAAHIYQHDRRLYLPSYFRVEAIHPQHPYLAGKVALQASR